MDIFGQKLPLNAMIRAKERCFSGLYYISMFPFYSTPDHKVD